MLCIHIMKTQHKKIYSRQLNIYSGLDKKKSLKLEAHCLKLLEANYHCSCGYGTGEHRHFPKILQVNPEKNQLIMTYVGSSFRSLKSTNNNMHVTVPGYKEQILCILENLKRSHVYHLDMHPNGKNLCFSSETGVLALIDFDIAVINRNPQTQILMKKLKSYSQPTETDKDYRNRMYHSIQKIIKSVR